MLATEKTMNTKFLNKEIFVPYYGLDDINVLILSVMDQSRLIIENLVKDIMNDKKLYKNEVKQVCKMLYNPTGKSIEPNTPNLPFMGWCRRIDYKIRRNMTEDEYNTFALMNGEIDDLLKLDLIKLKNAISLEVAKHNISAENVFTNIVYAIVYADICRVVASSEIDKFEGNIISLCKEPKNYSTHRQAYRITNAEIDMMLEVLTKLLRKIAPNTVVMIPEEGTITFSLTAIAQKMKNPMYLYQCAENVGLDLRKTSNPNNFPENMKQRLEESRREALDNIAHSEKVKDIIAQREKEKQDLEVLAEDLTSKGWKVSNNK